MEKRQPLLNSSSSATNKPHFHFHPHTTNNRSSNQGGDLEMNNMDNGTTRDSSQSAWSLGSLWRKSSPPPQADPGKIRKVPTKIEPKVFFSNERTFLSWLNMAVTLATISLAVIA
jgi:hypothetical protein